uniref:Uncharacterized protein n=1 Tax=Rhizophora mucronata TaxID=61149 RepID=A0A2P2PGT4_RHIMU
MTFKMQITEHGDLGEVKPFRFQALWHLRLTSPQINKKKRKQKGQKGDQLIS